MKGEGFNCLSGAASRCWGKVFQRVGEGRHGIATDCIYNRFRCILNAPRSYIFLLRSFSGKDGFCHFLPHGVPIVVGLLW